MKFISDNESRIREETQYYDGEETLVWRWVVPANIITQMSPKPVVVQEASVYNNETNRLFSTSSNNENRNISQGNNNSKWQNDLYSKAQDRVMQSPTPCLKIRNMFDQEMADEDPFFLLKIQNDILARCAHVKSIWHISCDKKSKEVQN